MIDFVGFRLNAVKDTDIIADLSKYKDTTARMKEAYRKALLVEQQGFRPSEQVAVTTPAKPPEKLVWNFPMEPSVPSTSKQPNPKKSQGSLKDSILNNGF